MYRHACSLILVSERNEEFITYCRWLSIMNALDFCDFVETSKTYRRFPVTGFRLWLSVSWTFTFILTQTLNTFICKTLDFYPNRYFLVALCDSFYLLFRKSFSILRNSVCQFGVLWRNPDHSKWIWHTSKDKNLLEIPRLYLIYEDSYKY